MSDREVLGWIIPDWPAPRWVGAGSTTRRGGVSEAPYDSLNLGDHVGDEPACVEENRKRLCDSRQLPARPHWLRQVHGTTVVDAATAPRGIEADACYTHHPDTVCAVLTADCLPVLLCNEGGGGVAAIHAGWRGLAAGIIEQTILKLDCPAHRLMAWLGPAIGPEAFEVGEEVRQAFSRHDPACVAAFRPSVNGRWLADLYALARRRLHVMGVTRVYGGHWCTYGNPERFYSYRRDGVTGRMATLIWLRRERLTRL